MGRDAGFDLVRELLRPAPFLRLQPAGQLIDGFDRVDRDHHADFTQQGIVGAPVKVRALRHQNNVRAGIFGVGDVHDVLHAERLGFLGRGDDAGAGGARKRNDAYGAAAQMRVRLLLDRGEEAVKVEIEPFYGVWFSQRGCPLNRCGTRNRTLREHTSQRICTDRFSPLSVLRKATIDIVMLNTTQCI